MWDPKFLKQGLNSYWKHSVSLSLSLFFFKLFGAMLDPCRCPGFFLVGTSGGYSPVAVRASHYCGSLVAEHGL